jgi:hypothetical protein
VIAELVDDAVVARLPSGKRGARGLALVRYHHAIATSLHRDGHPALFPDELREWAELVLRSQRLATLAVGVAERDGMPPPDPPDAEAVSARTAQLEADLIEPAKASALEKLGESERAFRIATGWLRGKLRVDEARNAAP